MFAYLRRSVSIHSSSVFRMSMGKKWLIFILDFRHLSSVVVRALVSHAEIVGSVQPEWPPPVIQLWKWVTLLVMEFEEGKTAD